MGTYANVGACLKDNLPSQEEISWKCAIYTMSLLLKLHVHAHVVLCSFSCFTSSVPPDLSTSCHQRTIRAYLSLVNFSGARLIPFDLVADDSVIALADNCLHLRSLGLYYCQNITDRAMYSLAHSRVNNKHEIWKSVKRNMREEEEGLINLNISQCTALTPPAVQAVCDSFPALHTCPGRHSLIISGCLSLTSVHCPCAGIQAHRAANALLHPAH